MRYLFFCVCALVIGTPSYIATTHAQQSLSQARASAPQQQSFSRRQHASNKRTVNQGTVSIIADTIGSTHTRMVADLAAVLDKGNDLRILPVIGRGAQQSITDILYLRGIDFGIVQSDVLTYIKQQRTFGNIENRVHYITKLHNQELHVIARKEIKSLSDLKGRKVNFGIEGSGAHITASAIFKNQNLQVEATNFDEVNALDKLVLGELAAMVYVAGKPAPLLAHIQSQKGLHLLPVPFDSSLSEYLPAKFEHRDYPGLVDKGRAVPTVAVRAVLAVFNWQKGTSRHAKVTKFISTLFTNFHELRKPPRHPKWREVNIHAKVPGWNRFPPATEWVARNAQLVAARREKLKPKKPSEKQAFKAFISRRGDGQQKTVSRESEQDNLFEQFLRWRKARNKQSRN